MKTEKKEYADPGKAYFGDIPLKVAALAWTPNRGNHSSIGAIGRIMIIPKLNERSDWWRHFGVTDSTCAVFCEWQNWTKQKRLLKLYIEVWHAICRDGIDPKAAHEACLVIPEYRDTLSGEWFFNEPMPKHFTNWNDL